MTSQIKIQDEVECDTCGDVAVTEYIGGGGGVSPLCANCDVHLRETMAGLHDARDVLDQWCDDCQEERANRRFLHLDGRQFALCESCYHWADHEDDYLMFCECRVPEGHEGSRCEDCHLQIRSAWGPEPEPDQEEPYVEEQDDDFPAEEPESEENDDDYREWATAGGEYMFDE
jgi:hypothetical protein